VCHEFALRLSVEEYYFRLLLVLSCDVLDGSVDGLGVDSDFLCYGNELFSGQVIRRSLPFDGAA